MTNENIITNTDSKIAIPENIQTALDSLRADDTAENLEVVKELLIKHKDEQFNIAVYALLDSHAVNPSTMFITFLDSPEYKYLTLKKSNADGYSLTEKAGVILFSELEKSYRAKHGTKLATGAIKLDLTKTLARSIRYEYLTSRLVHNLTRDFITSLNERGKDEDAPLKKTHVPALAGKFADISADVDFSSNSISAMIGQLNAVTALLLPEDLSIKMLRSDVRALQAAFKGYNIKDGIFTIRGEKSVIDIIFNSIRTRRADSAYTVVSKATAHRADKKTSPKPEDKPTEQTETPETPETPEKQTA